MLIRCEEVKRVLCATVIDDALLVSVRTSEDDEDAGQLAQKVLDGLGHGGGHAHRAGGKIADVTSGPGVEAVERELRSRWVRLFDRDPDGGVGLVDGVGMLGNR